MNTVKVTYNIKLHISDQPEGTISFNKISFLTEKILKIAKGALQIRVNGISNKKRKGINDIEKLLNINLKAINSGSTILQCETQTFGNNFSNIQIDAFRPEVVLELENQNPLSLFIKTFNEVLDEKDLEKPYLDKFLIKEMNELKNIYNNNTDALIISDINNTTTLKLNINDFNKIKQIEESYPEPKKVVVNGKIDTLKYSKSKVIINTKKGKIYGILKNEELIKKIKFFWGEDATVIGIGHFKPKNILNYIEIEQIEKPSNEDKYFSKIPFSETTEEQLLKQSILKENKNWAEIIFGKWSGDQTDEEFDNLLNEL